MFAPLLEYSTSNLRYPPVQLGQEQRVVLCDALVERLRHDGVEIVALAVMVDHFHLLARFPRLAPAQIARLKDALIRDGRDPAPRHFLGLARKHASHVLGQANLKPESPVWGKRPKFDPCRDRQHQLNVASYIVDHLEQGAAVWHLKWSCTRCEPRG